MQHHGRPPLTASIHQRAKALIWGSCMESIFLLLLPNTQQHQKAQNHIGVGILLHI